MFVSVLCDLNINCHPLEFSSYIQFSECVYTTTFHGTIFTLLNHKNCAIYSCSKKLKDLLERTHKEEAMLSLTATYDEFESLITKQHSYELFETIIEKRKESQKIYIDVLNHVKSETESESVINNPRNESIGIVSMGETPA